MHKLLVEAPSGQQEIAEVETSGQYFDASSVIWDERTDGPLPEVTLGGMVRVMRDVTIEHPAVMAEDGRGEYTQVTAEWTEEKTIPVLEFDQALLDARPEAVLPPVVVPMHKAREALIRSGVSVAVVDAAIAAIEDDVERELARNAWEYSPTVSSNSELVQTLGAALNLDVPALFAYARSLP